jgi:hypothetical protein
MGSAGNAVSGLPGRDDILRGMEGRTMTTADFGICPVHGPVPGKHDFSWGVIVTCIVLTVLVGIGLIILMIYVLYVLTSKDRICLYCGAVLVAPVVPVYPAPYYVPGYYGYPPYTGYPPYRPPGR